MNKSYHPHAHSKKMSSKPISILVLVLVLIIVVILLASQHLFPPSSSTEQESTQLSETPMPIENRGTIVIDAGHGGADPGKVGVTGLLEKDINLQIALKLKDVLEANGFTIVLTRDTDKDLASFNAQSRKMEDLKNRILLINDTNPLFTISIHQNSYPDESVRGPQVFYHSESEISMNIASILQSRINSEMQIEKPREIKGNVDYFLLKNTPSPMVIVECGFLSNPDESALLADDSYQSQMAEAIGLGVLDYINGTTAPDDSTSSENM